MTSLRQMEHIAQRLLPLRNELLTHSLYGEIRSLKTLQCFMEHHVFAVWDFMSLLKALQQQLCCPDVPWLPPTDSLSVRFVNEIVLGEESDEDGEGSYASHFELYHRAMTRCGADTRSIDEFLTAVQNGTCIRIATEQPRIPASVRQFVRHTFDVIATGDLCQIASAFTFGREDLLPHVFQRIVDQLDTVSDGGLKDFRYYLNRHIELDGEHHGPMAVRLMMSLCGDNDQKWQEVERAAVESLLARRRLWDGLLAAVTGQQATTAPAAVSESAGQ